MEKRTELGATTRAEEDDAAAPTSYPFVGFDPLWVGSYRGRYLSGSSGPPADRLNDRRARLLKFRSRDDAAHRRFGACSGGTIGNFCPPGDGLYERARRASHVRSHTLQVQKPAPLLPSSGLVVGRPAQPAHKERAFGCSYKVYTGRRLGRLAARPKYRMIVLLLNLFRCTLSPRDNSHLREMHFVSMATFAPPGYTSNALSCFLEGSCPRRVDPPPLPGKRRLQTGPG
jgi:hypothetical protein